MLKATLPKTETDNGRNRSQEKELVSYWKVIAYSKGEFHEPIDCRCWMGRSKQASTVYCSIWIRDRRNGRWYAGNGSAGGYGYHKESAAIGDAIDSAGVQLTGSVSKRNGEAKGPAHIHGVGESAIKAALEAIARALGFRKYTIVIG